MQVRGPGGEQRKTTGEDGSYSFPALRAGKYNVRVIAKGFSVSGRQDVQINGPVVLDAQLIIQADTQVLNVDDEANSVVADPTSNGSALVLRDKELSALSDDPDELQQQLQAMAGPGAGPNGGQIYIDGFTGGNLPNKSSIREVRINSNPFSPEYERPGFGRIEILTNRDGHAARAGVWAIQQGGAELAQSAADQSEASAVPPGYVRLQPDGSHQEG